MALLFPPQGEAETWTFVSTCSVLSRKELWCLWAQAIVYILPQTSRLWWTHLLQDDRAGVSSSEEPPQKGRTLDAKRIIPL